MMKTTLTALALLIAAACLANADPNKEFDTRVAAIKLKGETEREALFEKYIEAVDRLREGFIKKGDLDGALVAGKVIEAAKKGTTSEETVPGLPPLRKILDNQLEKIDSAETRQLIKLRKAQIKHLDEQVVELTKAGKLEEAIAAKEALKKHKILLESELDEVAKGKEKSALDSFGNDEPSARGLTIQFYKIQPKQVGGDNYNGYIHYKEFVEPDGKPKKIKSLNWSKSSSQNAVVSGYLKIEKSGTYGFRTNSDFDRNELIVDGKIVCPFRDGEGKHQSIELKEGLVPIVSVGYVRQTRYTSVKWKPPGQEEWSDIPTNLLFH